MPDEMDRVQEACDRLLEDALAERFRLQRLANPPKSPFREGGLENSPLYERGAGGDLNCSDCDNPIPPARLAVQPNAARCVSCQNDFELEMNFRRHL